MLQPEDISDAPLPVVLRIAPSLLRHPVACAPATQALLDRLPFEEPPAARRIAQLLAANGGRTAERTARVLDVLGVSPAPVARELLGCAAQLVGDTEEELACLVDTVKQLIATDRTLMLPALGALGEVALPEALKPELARLALGALPLADEPDLPTLLRCVLGTVAPARAGQTLRAMHAQLGAVAGGTLALLLQVVGNTLRVNGAIARSLLAQCGAASVLGRWDVLLLLLLLPLPRHTAVATQALSRALRRGALSASQLADCAVDAALPAAALDRLPALAAALLADTAANAPAHGAALACALVASSAAGCGGPSGMHAPSHLSTGGGASSSAAFSLSPSEATGTSAGWDGHVPGEAAAADATLSSLNARALSEVLSALFGPPSAAAAAAAALAALAERAPHKLGSGWPLLHEAMAHAPKLAPWLLPPFCECLAAATACQPALRPPLLLFIQKHAFGSGPALGHAPYTDSGASFDAALLLAERLVRTRGALDAADAALVVRWLVQAVPLTPSALGWQMIGRCAVHMPDTECDAMLASTLPDSLLSHGIAFPPPSPPLVAASAAAKTRALPACAAALASPVGGDTRNEPRGDEGSGVGAAPLPDILVVVRDADDALARGLMWLQPPPPVNTRGEAFRAYDPAAGWLDVMRAQLLCAFRCAEARAHTVPSEPGPRCSSASIVTASGAGTAGSAGATGVPGAARADGVESMCASLTLSAEAALRWRFGLPSELAAVEASARAAMGCVPAGSTDDAPPDAPPNAPPDAPPNAPPDAPPDAPLGGLQSSATAATAQATAAMADGGGIASSVNVRHPYGAWLSLARHALAVLTAVDVSVRWHSHTLPPLTATHAQRAARAAPGTGIAPLPDDALLRCMAKRSQLVLLISHSLQLAAMGSAARDEAEAVRMKLQADLAACLKRPLHPRLCVRCIAALHAPIAECEPSSCSSASLHRARSQSTAGTSSCAHADGGSDCVSHPRLGGEDDVAAPARRQCVESQWHRVDPGVLRLHWLREVAKSAQRRHGTAGGASLPTLPGLPPRSELSSGASSFACGSSRQAGAMGERRHTSAGGSALLDPAVCAHSDVDGDEADDGPKIGYIEGGDGGRCWWWHDSTGGRLGWQVEAMPVLVHLSTELCDAVDDGRRAVGSASGGASADAWRRDLEALAITYRVLAACASSQAVHYGSIAPSVRIGWLSVLRRQLRKLAEAHLAAALAEAVATIDRLRERVELDEPMAGMSMTDTPGTRDTPPAVAGAPVLELGLRALRTLYPMHLATFATYLPALRAPSSPTYPNQAQGNDAAAADSTHTDMRARASTAGAVAYLVRVRSSDRRQHGALCSLVNATLCAAPSADASLACARAFSFAVGELTAKIQAAAAASTPEAAARRSSEQNQRVNGVRRSDPLPSHAALPLLTPAARPIMLLTLLGHLAIFLQQLVPLRTTAALRRALTLLRRAGSLASHLLRAIRPYGSTYGPLLCAGCVAWTEALHSLAISAIECRCRPGCPLPPVALSEARGMLKRRRGITPPPCAAEPQAPEYAWSALGRVGLCMCMPLSGELACMHVHAYAHAHVPVVRPCAPS